MNGVVILRSVGPGATDDPDERSRSVDSLQALGQLTLPARPNDGKIAGARAGGALPDSCERIRPHIQQLQQVVAALCVRHRDDDRLLSQIKPSHGVKGVEVSVSGSAERRRRKRPCVRKSIHGPASKHLARLDVGEVLARDIHDH